MRPGYRSTSFMLPVGILNIIAALARDDGPEATQTGALCRALESEGKRRLGAACPDPGPQPRRGRKSASTR